MPPDWLPRGEFEGYTRRHEADEDAHGKLIRRLRTEGDEVREAYDSRLGALERWRWIITGAVGMLTFLASTGVIAAVVELLRK